MSISYQTVSGTAEPLPDDVLVIDMEQGNRIHNGVIVLDDTNFSGISDQSSRTVTGVRPRWATVYKVGSNVDFVSAGEYALIAHGRWSYAIDFNDETGQTVKLQKVDSSEILLVNDVMPPELAAYKAMI